MIDDQTYHTCDYQTYHALTVICLRIPLRLALLWLLTLNRLTRVCACVASGKDCGPVFARGGTVQKREGGVDEIGGIPYFSSFNPYPASAFKDRVTFV